MPRDGGMALNRATAGASKRGFVLPNNTRLNILNAGSTNCGACVTSIPASARLNASPAALARSAAAYILRTPTRLAFAYQPSGGNNLLDA